MAKPLGYIGIGNMGLPMAGRLMDAGHRLVVRDIDDSALKPLVERQAQAAASAKQVGDRAEVVFASLPSNAVIREVLLGADGLIHGSAVRIYVSACTTGSPFAAEMSAALAQRGIATLEAPISGGPSGARAGTLSVMVSGPKAAYEEVAPCFQAYGAKVVYCGEKPGLAQLLKLANNVIYATVFLASAEALAMGVKAGLDPRLMLEAIAAGSGRNAAVDEVFPRHVVTRSFDYGAALEILMKDVDLALAEGEAQGVPQLVCQQARQLCKLAMHKGWHKRDVSELVKLIEGWAGVEIKAADE